MLCCWRGKGKQKPSQTSSSCPGREQGGGVGGPHAGDTSRTGGPSWGPFSPFLCPVLARKGRTPPCPGRRGLCKAPRGSPEVGGSCSPAPGEGLHGASLAEREGTYGGCTQGTKRANLGQILILNAANASSPSPCQEPTAIDARRRQLQPGQAPSPVLSSPLGNVPKRCRLRHRRRAGSLGTSRPTGLHKQTAERARRSVQGFARCSLSGSHGQGHHHPRPRGTDARDRRPLQSPAPRQHHGIEGRRDPSPGGLPHSCDESVGALLRLGVPWGGGIPPLPPRHLCR